MDTSDNIADHPYTENRAVSSVLVELPNYVWSLQKVGGEALEIGKLIFTSSDHSLLSPVLPQRFFEVLLNFRSF